MKKNNKASDSIIKIGLSGKGEDATRMEKRLYCAARALDIRILVEWNSEDFGPPIVRLNNEVLIDHLVETTVIETLFRDALE